MISIRLFPARASSPTGNRWRRAAFALLSALAAFAAPASAQAPHVSNVAASLQSSRAAIAPEERFTIVLRQEIRQGWHTYWRNPGDTGQATEIAWTLPPGFTAGPLQFPPPKRIPVDVLMNYGYAGEVLFPIEIAAPRRLRVGSTVTLRAHANWLVCSDICIPEEADLTLALPVRATGADDPAWKPRIDAALASLPRPGAIQARVSPQEGGALLTFVGEPVANARDAHFFPYRSDVIDHSAPEGASRGPLGVSLQLKPGAQRGLGTRAIEGVLTLESRGPRGWTPMAYEVRAEPGPPLAGASGARPRPAAGGLTLPLALLFAFLGGVLLNAMPCVFPVLSLKALSFVRSTPAEARRAGFSFLLGVMTTFLALAGLIVALKAGGTALGWGFQLQTPLVVAGLATLFFLIGLNLVGVFAIGGRIQNVGASLAARGGDAGAFFTGMLAVLAATPCTAPFMASATGFAATQSAPVALAVFAALGLGFAAPFAALAFIPALRKRLPKPGQWMERVKVVLGFPMLAAAAWLAWVVAKQAGPDGLMALLIAFTAIAFALVVGRWGLRWRIVGAVVLLAALALAWRPLTAPAEAEAAEARAWSPARVSTLINQGHGVFVDFTAAWCVTCQVNKIVVLDRPAVRRAFARHGVVLLEADWTNRDSAIAAALAEHGRDGVPLYLYYPPGSLEPQILPQILTEGIVMKALREPGSH